MRLTEIFHMFAFEEPDRSPDFNIIYTQYHFWFQSVTGEVFGKKRKKKREKKIPEGEEDGTWWSSLVNLFLLEKVKERDEESRPIQKQWKETKRSWGGNILKGVDQKVVSLLLETECWHHRSVLSICHISLVGDFYRLLLKSGNSGMKWEQKNFPRSFLKCGHAYQSGQDLRLENTLHCSSLPLCSSLSDSFFIWIPSPLFCSRTFTILSSFQKCLSLSLLPLAHSSPRFKFSSWTPSKFLFIFLFLCWLFFFLFEYF